MALSEREKYYLFLKHEANRLRFFNKPKQSSYTEALAAIVYETLESK